MTLTRLKPFGARRKTYFYGVAGFVLAAHVVVGAIIRVMPPDFIEPGTIIPVEVQIVDHLLPDDVVESSAVRMVEEAPEEEPPVFVPVWEPSPVAPELEPLGPTETILPDVVIDEELEVPAKPTAEIDESDGEPAPAPVVASPPERRTKPASKSAAPPAKPDKPEPRKVESTPPAAAEPAAPEPAEPEIERAIPVRPTSPGRTGILNRLRSRPDPAPRDEPYEAATWAKRPPPFYPYEARKRSIEGTAHVRVSIDSRGRITAARLTKSSGDSLLDEAAMASVRKGVLNPARRGGRAVPSEMLVPFEFYLP